MAWPEHDDLVARSFVLREDVRVQDPADFAAHHEDYMVPLADEGGAAAWCAYVARSGGYAEGYVSLVTNNLELVDPRVCTTVDGFWRTVCGVLEKYIRDGEGSQLLEDQPLEIGVRWVGPNRAKFWIGTRKVMVTERFLLRLAQAASDFFQWMHDAIGGVGDRDLEQIRELATRLQTKVDVNSGTLPMRPLTNDEIDVVRHICEHGEIDEADGIDRSKLVAQIAHVTARPGCDVDGCPCIEFAYKGQPVWSSAVKVAPHELATSVGRATIVMGVRDSPWLAHLFVDGGVLSFLEFSSDSGDFPRRLPTPDDFE